MVFYFFPLILFRSVEQTLTYYLIKITFYKISTLKLRLKALAKNYTITDINNYIQDMIPGIVTEYSSIDTVVRFDDVVNYPVEFLNSLDPPGMPPHRLRLKVVSPIMLKERKETLCFHSSHSSDSNGFAI